MAERSWVQIPPSAGLFLSSFFLCTIWFISDVSLNRSFKKYKFLAGQLEAKQTLYARIEQKNCNWLKERNWKAFTHPYIEGVVTCNEKRLAWNDQIGTFLIGHYRSYVAKKLYKWVCSVVAPTKNVLHFYWFKCTHKFKFYFQVNKNSYMVKNTG